MVEKRLLTVAVIIGLAFLISGTGLFSTISTRGQLNPATCTQTGSQSFECNSRDPIFGTQILGATYGIAQLDTDFNELNQGIYTVYENTGVGTTDTNNDGTPDKPENKEAFTGTCKIKNWAGTDSEGGWQAKYTVTDSTGEITGYNRCRIKTLEVKVDCRSTVCNDELGSGTYTLPNDRFDLNDASSSYIIEFQLEQQTDTGTGDIITDPETETLTLVQRLTSWIQRFFNTITGLIT